MIQTMRQRAESARESELQRLFQGLTHLPSEDRAQVEEFARRFQNKLLHDPTVRLRKGMAEGAGPELVEAVRFLYGIADPGSPTRAGDEEAMPSPTEGEVETEADQQ